MALTEDLDLFLNTDEMAVSAVSGAITGNVILDMPGETVAGGMVITTEYMATAKTEEFGGLLYGDGITVNGINYQVREVMLIDDGKFCQLSLSKLAPPATAPGGQPREFGLADLADVTLTNPQQGDMLINDGTTFVNTPEVNGGGA